MNTFNRNIHSGLREGASLPDGACATKYRNDTWIGNDGGPVSREAGPFVAVLSMTGRCFLGGMVLRQQAVFT